MRRDALANRQRLLEAADTMFRERGVDVGVAEIAAAAGVGRGTLFRNFASKDALIAAVLAERIGEVLATGADLLANDPDDADVAFRFVEELMARQEENRALLQALTEETLHVAPELERTHTAMMELLEALLERGKRAGAIRPEATAGDLMMLIKGLCMYPAADQPLAPETILRHLDLVRAALTTPEYSRPLRGVSVDLTPVPALRGG
ncbi:MAG TPA: TetR family transcriptional regulator [Solirubrobacteraceae bacterium]|jgi:AcrR family transcriptional regulator|nr:TetR family transcriptional regulator [Solirubrobacteraceae bacterium]